jgi:hypothetical protein
VGGAGGAVLACTLLVPSDEVQCATASDCRARGPAFATAVCVASVCQVGGDAGASPEAGANDPWACLDRATLESDPAAAVDVQIITYNALSPVTFGGSLDGGNDLTLVAYAPEIGVTVVACSSLDPVCASPIAGPTLTDDAGVARLVVAGSFNGFYSLTRSDSVPSLFYPGRLVEGESSIGFPTSLVSRTSYTALQGSLGIASNLDTDAGPGLVAVTQYDCNERRASGAVFTATPVAARTLYVANGLPSNSATQTSSDGSGLLVDVPAGSVSIASTLAGPNARPLVDVNVLVRSGSITLVKLRPRVR